MKKFYAIAAMAALGSACVSFKMPVRFESGVYEASAQGYGGPLRVAVETDAASILDIRILQSSEDPFIGGEALRELTDRVLETDSADLDAVSGATITSDAFLSAVNEALAKARLKP
jgi:uncharacterized protein with FMN-binding domain